jgi:hypothetical protein
MSQLQVGLVIPAGKPRCPVERQASRHGAPIAALRATSAIRVARPPRLAAWATTRPKRSCSQPRSSGGACRTSAPSASIAISSTGSSQIANVLSPTDSTSSLRIRSQSAWSHAAGTPSVRRTSSRLTFTRRWRFRPLAVV